MTKVIPVCLFLVSLVAVRVWAQSNENEDVTLMDPVAVELVASEGIGHLALIKLEDLVPGRRYRCPVSITNSTEKDFVFSIVNSDLASFEFPTENRQITVGDTSVAIMKFEVPQSTANGQFGFRVDFFDGVENMAGMISVASTMAGNLHVGSASVPQRDRESRSYVWKLPVSYTAPVVVKHLEAELSDSMDGFQWKFVEGDKGSCVFQLSIPENELPGEIVFGVVRIKDRVIGSEAKIVQIRCRIANADLPPDATG